jgi:AcrR family transcriptional regulator
VAESRAEQKAATAKAVLEAARDEFEQEGFDGATIRGIAARAGVSPGTVIHHHGEKRELLHAALFADLERTLSRALAQVGDGPLEDQLQSLAGALFRYYGRRPRLSRALLKESLFADEPWASRFREQVAQVHARLGQLIAEAARRGELESEADGTAFGIAYLSFYYFALISWVQGAVEDPIALIDRMVRQHLRGLRPLPAGSPARKK